jgi:serine phosphatase RsbU (regulator of sigma subunit)
MGQRLTYWIFLGIIGFAVFFVLQSSISFNGGAPIEQSRTSIEDQTEILASKLGFSVDSLNMLTYRTQHLSYYKTLQDSADGDLPTAKTLNQKGVNLTGWKVNIAKRQKEGAVAQQASNIMGQQGRMDVRYDQQGRVRRISTYTGNENPTFVAGDSLFAIATHIVEDILEYNLDEYQLNYVDVKDSLLSTNEPGYSQRPLNFSDTSVGNNLVFEWSKKEVEAGTPASISLEVKPIIRETNTDQNIADIRYGVAIEKFEALDQHEPKQLDSENSISNFDLITTFGSLGILIILVFYMGIKYINKGQVEWRRALIILVALLLGVFGWRMFYLMNMTSDLLNQTSEAIYVLNTLLFAAAVSLYGALGYIGWEANARSRDEEQLHLLDAFWRKRFFFRETGEGLLRGYALGGAMLGLFAVGLYLLGTEFFQSDSQYGFTEASLQPKLLTINMAAWVNVWLVALGHVGITLGFMKSNINRNWLYYGFGIVLLGFVLSGSATLFEIVGSEWFDLIIYTVLGVVIVYALEVSGLLTFSTGWWVFTVIMLVMPYWGSPNMNVAYVSWIQFFILGIPLIYGIIAYRYGDSVSEMGGYIPEYQERIANHLRVEKEIEIARESQFKLMPLQPPSVEGVDVYGFFMPSFEVGGDYFDYIVSSNGTPDSYSLNMTIADVSGKAMKAAMHAVFTSGLLLSRLHRDAPEAILREITPTLHTRTDPQTFITCIIAQYNISSRKLRLANAGHCLPILKRDGEAKFIETPAPKYPLGVRFAVDYEPLDIKLQEGDFLLLYSDGLPEAVNPEGERFGFDNLITLVESMDTDSRPSNEISMDIKRRVQKFSDYQLADDTTIICLKV